MRKKQTRQTERHDAVEDSWRLLESAHANPLTQRYDQAMKYVADDLILTVCAPESLTEGKSPALRKSDPISRMSDQASLDPRYKRKSGKAFKKYQRMSQKRQRTLEKELKGIIDTYSSGRGRLPFGKVRSRIENKLRAAHTNAFEFGMRAAGLTGFVEPTNDPTIKKRIDSALKEELKYLNKFLNQLEVGQARGNPVRRIAAYAETVESSFEQGRIMAMPSVSIIHWHLESDDPCPDCVLISRHSPFTRETLPTVPRAGLTRCLNHCQCSLEVQPVTEKRIGQVRRKHLSRKELIKRIHRQQKQQMGRRL